MPGNRRSFFKRMLGLFGGGGLLSVPTSVADHPGGTVGEHVAPDPAAAHALRDGQSTDVHTDLTFDLVIAGGGIAGTTAAISAARNGVKVALVHERSMLGGNSSSEVKLVPENIAGHRAWVKEMGIHDEFHTEERVRDHQVGREGLMNCHWDLVLYEKVILEPNITLFLNTHMHRVTMRDAKRIDSIYCIQLGSERTFMLRAPLFLDATGDGVLAHRAGAECRWGREARSEYGEEAAPDTPDENKMGSTLFFRAVDTGRPVPFARPEWAAEFPTEDDLYKRGHSHVEGGYWWIEVGTPYHQIHDNNAITHEALRQLLGVWDHIKNRGDHGAENYGLEFVGWWPYKRECRRIMGDYVISQQHLQDPKPLDDAVAYGAWSIDIHTQGGVLARDQIPCPPLRSDEYWDEVSTYPYGIPLRALYSKNVENLMMAGRPISCSYVGFSSSRVLSTGCIVGQAAGVAASICTKKGATPRDVAQRHAREVQQLLLTQDGHIPGVVNEDPNDLARQAKVTASNSAALHFPEGVEPFDLSVPHAQIFPVSGDRVDGIALFLQSELDADTEVSLTLREAPHVWDFRSTVDLASATALVPARSRGWVTFPLNARVTPERFYAVYLPAAPGLRWLGYQDEHGKPCVSPVGVTPADLPGAKRWRPMVGGVSLAMRVSPEIRPFEAANVSRGTNRPDQWTNLWISDPSNELPATLELGWPKAIACNTIQLTFDTNANYRVRDALFRYPECIRDYRLEYRNGSKWKSIAEVTGNYVRRRVHRFDRVTTDTIRLTALATNGAPSARVYEVRVYDEA